MSYHNPRYPHQWVTKSGNSVVVTNPAQDEYHFNIVLPDGTALNYYFYTDYRNGEDAKSINESGKDYAAFKEAHLDWSQYDAG